MSASRTPELVFARRPRWLLLGIYEFPYAAIMAIVLFAGCGKGRDVELVEVEGYVTLDGRPPPAAGVIYFSPVEAAASQPLRPTQANCGPDGYYRAAAFDDSSGLVPAKYRVGIHCWEIAPSMGGPPSRSYIPEHYTSPATSGLELVVASGSGDVHWNIELQSNAQ